MTLDFLDGIPHFYTKFGIQIGQRFIHEEYCRLDDNSPRQGNPLLLAAGKGGGHTVF